MDPKNCYSNFYSYISTVSKNTCITYLLSGYNDSNTFLLNLKDAILFMPSVAKEPCRTDSGRSTLAWVTYAFSVEELYQHDDAGKSLLGTFVANARHAMLLMPSEFEELYKHDNEGQRIK